MTTLIEKMQELKGVSGRDALINVSNHCPEFYFYPGDVIDRHNAEYAARKSCDNECVACWLRIYHESYWKAKGGES